MNIRFARPEDMKEIYNIELLTFPPQEAATPETYPYRLKNFPRYFFVAKSDGRVVAFLSGRPVSGDGIKDEMYHNEDYPKGFTFALLSVAVNPEFQQKGFGSTLVRHAITAAKSMNCENMILACKEDKIPFYQKLGFDKIGLSQSSHGGAVWYDMRMDF